VTRSFCPFSVALLSIQPVNRNEYQGISLGGKGGGVATRGADKSAILVVLNVKGRMEAKYSISSLGLLDL
jgi:hypothetical protein